MCFLCGACQSSGKNVYILNLNAVTASVEKLYKANDTNAHSMVCLGSVMW